MRSSPTSAASATSCSARSRRGTSVWARGIVWDSGLTLGAAFHATGDDANIRSPYGTWPGWLSLIETDFDRANEKAFGVGLKYDFGEERCAGLRARAAGGASRTAYGVDRINPTTGAALPDTRRVRPRRHVRRAAREGPAAPPPQRVREAGGPDTGLAGPAHRELGDRPAAEPARPACGRRGSGRCVMDWLRDLLHDRARDRDLHRDRDRLPDRARQDRVLPARQRRRDAARRGHRGAVRTSRVSPQVKAVCFGLFIFSVGYKSGPQFFASLNRASMKPDPARGRRLRDGPPGRRSLAAKIFSLDVGTAAGVLAGACTESASIGTAGEAIGRLGLDGRGGRRRSRTTSRSATR